MKAKKVSKKKTVDFDQSTQFRHLHIFFCICVSNFLKVYFLSYSGDAMFHGPWIVLPSDIPHAPSRLFYKQEVFISTLEDTNAVANIIGKCAVLEHAEYISC